MSKDFLLFDVSTDTIGTPIFGDNGEKSLTMWGDFGGGTIILEISDADGIFVPITENGGNTALFTAATSRILLKIPSTQLIRASLVASVNPSGINVVISG